MGGNAINTSLVNVKYAIWKLNYYLLAYILFIIFLALIWIAKIKPIFFSKNIPPKLQGCEYISNQLGFESKFESIYRQQTKTT